MADHGGLAYRADIDGLRALAISIVVAFHAFPALLPGGFVGVDIFFVISGYLIGAILLQQLAQDRFSFVDFYLRRIKRIFPALLIVLLVSYGVGWFYLIDTEYKELGKEIAASVACVANLALWHDAGYFDAAAATKPLLHLWSLGVEEQFYLLWPLVLWGCKKARIRPLPTIAAAGIGSFMLNLAMAHSNPVADFYSPLTRCWELMIGCALAHAHRTQPRRPVRHAHACGLIGITLIVVAVTCLKARDGFPGWAALLPTLGACLIIAGGTDGWINRHVLQARLLVCIGLISFPLYLWHWPLLVFCRVLSLGTPAWPVRLLAIAIAGVLAWLTYQWVEKPIRFGSKRRWAVPVLLGLMTATGLQGWNTYRRDGMEFRLAHMLTQFAHVQHDVRAAWRENSCFLGGRDGTNAFAASCTDAGNKPIVFLWGDSHAAALYPGLRSLQQGRAFGIAEYTAASCPPLLGANAVNARCADINQNILARIRQIRPAEVVLTANWTSAEVPRIASSVQALRGAGITHIVIIGPVPAWLDALPKVYWLYWRQYHQVLPARTQFDLAPQSAEIDAQIQAVAHDLNVPYLSAVQALCNRDGCLSRTGSGKGELVDFDISHLTPSGSTALMQVIGPRLLGLWAAPQGSLEQRSEDLGNRSAPDHG